MATIEFSDKWNQEQEKQEEKERLEQQKVHQRALQRKNDFHKLLESYGQLLFNPLDLFTTAVIGELKSGKSTFINALLGGNLLYSKSSSATAFPLRIVHDVAQKNNISIKYIYNQDTINELVSTLNKYDIDTNISNTVRKFFSITSTEKKNGLNSKNVYSELETLNSILRNLNDVDNYPVEKLLTSLVPEISLNFKSFSLNGFVDLPTKQTFTNIHHKAVFIDTPGIGESGSLNDLFKWLIDDICQKVDYNILLLEKGGRNTANEFEIVQMLRNSRQFSVVASKLDDYNEDLDFLLKEDIPNRFTKFENFYKVYGVSQHNFLVGNIVLNDFKEHGAIIDTGDSYIENILKDVYGRKEVKQYRNKAEGYEKYLKRNDDYMDVLNDLYLHGKGQDFLQILEDLYVKIYNLWKKEAIADLKFLVRNIDYRVYKYLKATKKKRQSLNKIKLKEKDFKEDTQRISSCLLKCFSFESYDYIITESNFRIIDNINNIQNIINFNKILIRETRVPIFKCDYNNTLWGGCFIIIPWIGWNIYHYGLSISTVFSFMNKHYINGTILVAYILFVLWLFYAKRSDQIKIASDIKKAPTFSSYFINYQELSEFDNVERMEYIIEKILYFHENI